MSEAFRFKRQFKYIAFVRYFLTVNFLSGVTYLYREIVIIFKVYKCSEVFLVVYSRFGKYFVEYQGCIIFFKKSGSVSINFLLIICIFIGIFCFCNQISGSFGDNVIFFIIIQTIRIIGIFIICRFFMASLNFKIKRKFFDYLNIVPFATILIKCNIVFYRFSRLNNFLFIWGM